MEEENFFAVPAGGEMEETDAPIILGGAPPESDAAFLGDVNEAPAVVADDIPIVLGGPAPVMEDVEDEAEQPVVEPESSEPTPMQKWTAEWQETLVARKDAENARKAEFVEAARVAMENFHVEREAKREAKMAQNRSDEQAKLEAIEADLENDNSWQRVCKMIELSHDNKAEAEDVKRMRDIMILLKNEPARAEALTN